MPVRTAMSWVTVGIGLGVAGTLAIQGATNRPLPAEAGARAAGAGDTAEGLSGERPRAPRSGTGDSGEPEPDVSVPAPTNVANERPPVDVEAAISELGRARDGKDRRQFERVLRKLLDSGDPRALGAVLELVSDDGFDFPDGYHAVRIGTHRAALASGLAGWTDAARARYLRDRDRPTRSWEAHGWLHLVAAHGDALDLAWVADQYDSVTERRGEIIAALGRARPEIARDALLREIRRPHVRDGLFEALGYLRERAPAVSFELYDAVIERGPPFPHHSDDDLLRTWVRTAPTDALTQVRARLHGLAELLPLTKSSATITAVQELAMRGEPTDEFAGLIASVGRELRRLVDEERRADGTVPLAAIRSEAVARTPENLAAIEYAIQRLGRERTTECQFVVERIREQEQWR